MLAMPGRPSTAHRMAPSPLQLSVAVFAHNEAGTVADCIASIADARTREVEVAEVIVVSSGSTDDTNATESHWRPLASSKGLTRADIAAHRVARGGRD